MNAKRTETVFWLTLIGCFIGVSGIEELLVPQTWQYATIANAVGWGLGCFLGISAARAVTRHFGLSLERQETENVPIPAPPIGPPYKKKQVIILNMYGCLAATVVFIAINVCFGVILARLHLYPRPYSAKGVIEAVILSGLHYWWNIQTRNAAVADEEGAGSGGKAKRRIAWCNVTSCVITKCYGVSGYLNKCTITLTDERNHNKVELLVTNMHGGQHQADELIYFVRWKLSQQAELPLSLQTALPLSPWATVEPLRTLETEPVARAAKGK